MRTFILIALLSVATTVKAQLFLPGGFIDYGYRGNAAKNINFNDSITQKKWFVSKYTGLNTSFSFFKGGNATVVSVPIGLQLNRRINNNLFAFAGISAAPAYVNFNSVFMGNNFNRSNGNNSFKSSALGLYSRAELGLMYVNDERTFSISGSIGIERNNFPIPAYLPLTNQNNQNVISKR